MSEKDEDFSIEEEYQGDMVKKLREKLRSAEDKAKEYLDGWQRERAEIANARKRDEESKQDFVKFASAGLIEELMPVLDAMSMAMSHGEKSVEPIQKLFLKTLKQYGLEELDPVGEEFDPRKHEAVATVNAERVEDENKILEVVQKGYIMHGKIIRPAKVKIGQING